MPFLKRSSTAASAPSLHTLSANVTAASVHKVATLTSSKKKTTVSSVLPSLDDLSKEAKREQEAQKRPNRKAAAALASGAYATGENAAPKRRKKKASSSDEEADGEEENGDENKAPYNYYSLQIPIDTAKTTSGTTLKKPFKVPAGSAAAAALNQPRLGTLGLRKANNLFKRPLHDPTEENALVLYAPEELSEQEKLDLKKSSALGQDQTIRVHVVVDPRLCKILRPHQREGVRFLYECTTGNKVEDYYGCIMADEMGLGKTLQCITLLWTLLRQSPQPGKPTIEKAVIVCPSSLVRNWANELIKWLGPHAITPLACDGKLAKDKMKRELNTYMNGQGRNKVYHCLIISYETLRMYSKQLQKCEIGLMLCDEGHRLKNSQNQTFQALNELNVKRRVILSGTPIQNDLTEYFSLLNFANPGLLGSPSDFRKKYELPILKGRDALASDAERKRSEEMLAEMLGIASKVIIRRTSDLLSKYLPVKYDHVVFVKMTPMQINMYNAFMASKAVKDAIKTSEEGEKGGQMPLKQITTLKKLCNHPSLVDLSEWSAPASSLLPAEYDPKQVQPIFSGKLLLLEKMLREIKQTTDDKVVLISNYTQTLDLFERMCRQRNWGSLRLDGTMTISKRQKLVDTFNQPDGHEFVFLLSSKAGGCGLNLVGANRLVLFDPDWNPANDGQALARVWRDGQKKDCFLYRFIATGTVHFKPFRESTKQALTAVYQIEEKIFQRQCHKQSLSDAVVDEDAETSRHFSVDDLRQLFKLNLKTACETHDTYKCKRCVMGRQVTKPFEEVPDEAEKEEEEAIRRGFEAPAEGIVGLDTDHATPRPPALSEDEAMAGEEEEVALLSNDQSGQEEEAKVPTEVKEEEAHLPSSSESEAEEKKKTKKKAKKAKITKVEETKPPAPKSSGANASSRKRSDMSNWNHWSEVELDKMHDTILKKNGKGLVTFVFQTKSHELKS